MIITVASGKGGTGKTAVSTSLSVIASRYQNHLIDCDVENPNADLYMKPEITETKVATVKIPRINMDECTRCNKCVEACQYGAIIDTEQDFLFFSNLCHSCAACWIICPEEAITPVPREFGDIYNGTSGEVRFTMGELDIGEMLTPSMIHRTKNEIDPENLTIIDGPPGAGCPLDETLEGSDYAILVTEPTIFGLHDLERAMKIVKINKIPVGVVINRAGIGDDQMIRDLCTRENVPVLMEIPFDRRIAEQYSDGTLLIDTLPELRGQFEAMLDGILMHIQEVST